MDDVLSHLLNLFAGLIKGELKAVIVGYIGVPSTFPSTLKITFVSC